MTHPEDDRPTPAEEEGAVARLADAYAKGILTTGEYELRLAEAYQAPTSEALVNLTVDLPEPAPSRALNQQTMSPQISTIMGSVERGGRLAVPAALQVRAIMGNVELDLRDADFVDGVTEINVRSICANVELWLPAYAQVECEGRALMGSFVHSAKYAAGGWDDEPEVVVRITGRAICANVEVFEEEGE